MAGTLGLALDLDGLAPFSETPARYLLEIEPPNLENVRTALGDLTHTVIGEFNNTSRLTLSEAALEIPIHDLLSAWLTPLNW